MSEPAPPRPPWTLAGAAVLVGLEGVLIAGLAVLEVLDLHSGRATMAVTTALFFLALAAGLLGCARGLFGVRSWARSMNASATGCSSTSGPSTDEARANARYAYGELKS